METFYVTYGMNHLDKDGNRLGNCYTSIIADTEAEARKKIFAVRGPRWSLMYPNAGFQQQIDTYGLSHRTLEQVRILPAV